MSRSAHAYPQVEPGAAAVATTRTRPLGAGTTVEIALAHAGAAGPVVWVTGPDAVVLREDLVRARDLGLGRLPAAAVHRPVPVTRADAPEVTVRRHLAAGAPVVLVRQGREIAAAMATARMRAPGPPMRRLVARLPRESREVLSTVSRLAAEARAEAWLVGGVVRDLLRGGETLPRVDVDVVVGGNALAIAERLAEAVAGRLVVHPRFLTASVDVPAVGIVDVVTARREHYEVRGALPRVARAGIDADLRRRDFTVNAMAIELASEDQVLLDPFDGRRDLTRRRLRILHPLSFVEDPTRIFRAARYAARLGLTPDAWTRRCRTLALGLVPYPALSGARILSELERVVEDQRPEAALGTLGAAGAFRLLDARYRFVRRTRQLLTRLPAAIAWAGAQKVPLRALDLALIVLLADQRPVVRAAALDRLGLTGDRRHELEQAWPDTAPAALVGSADRPSARAARLRALRPLGLAALHLRADATSRATLDWWAEVARRAIPDLRGDDLLALGVPRGPAVARVLAALRDARIDETVTDRRSEVAYVQRWLETEKEG